jgi:membrane-bound ClpP family serine protease
LDSESHCDVIRMILSILIAIIVVVSLLLAGLTAVLSLRKRFANRDLRLVGESARVETTLTPDGTVIVGGELWPAQSTDGEVIPAQCLVRIVGVQDLSLLVEACN